MNAALGRALAVGLPVAVLLAFSIARLVRSQNASALLQLLGAGCLALVILTHVAEALHLLPMMGWGEPDSVGHYLDLSSAVFGVTLLGAAVIARLVRS